MENLSFRYHKKMPLVLDQVNFAIQSGEIVALTGPNGSGKTTFIKHLNGLLTPTSGSLYLRGRKVEKPRELVKEVGVVFQNPNDQVFFPVVEDDIAFGPRNLSLPDEEVWDRVTRALEDMGISHLRKRSFAKLSFGEKKKVSLAGVLASDPQVMVLDEPTIGVDAWSKPAFVSLIRSLRDDNPNRTILLATHDYDLLQIVDRTYLLWDGRVRGIYDTVDDFIKEAMAFPVT